MDLGGVPCVPGAPPVVIGRSTFGSRDARLSRRCLELCMPLDGSWAMTVTCTASNGVLLRRASCGVEGVVLAKGEAASVVPGDTICLLPNGELEMLVSRSEPGWEGDDDGEVLHGGQPRFAKGAAAPFKFSQPLQPGDVVRMRVDGLENNWVGFAGGEYNPCRHWDTAQFTAAVDIGSGTPRVNSGVSLDEQQHAHPNHLARHIPKTVPYNLALRCDRVEQHEEGSVPQIQFNDDGVWHDFAPAGVAQGRRAGRVMLKVGPCFPFLRLKPGNTISRVSVDHCKPTKSAGKRAPAFSSPTTTRAAGAAAALSRIDLADVPSPESPGMVTPAMSPAGSPAASPFSAGSPFSAAGAPFQSLMNHDSFGIISPAGSPRRNNVNSIEPPPPPPPPPPQDEEEDEAGAGLYEGAGDGIDSGSSSCSSSPARLPDRSALRRSNKVELSGIGLTSVPEDVRSNRRAIFIDLHNNKISEIDHFAPNSNLQTLWLHQNSLAALGGGLSGAGKGCSSLRTLRLSQNSLTALPAGMRCPQLTALDLAHNRLSSLPTPLLSNHVQLTDLDMSFNAIRMLPPAARYEDMVALKSLDLSHNRVFTVPATLGRLPSLAQLCLNNNEISVIPAELVSAEPHHASMVELRLDHNSIVDLPDVSLSSLTTLTLQDNQLRSLPRLFGRGLTRMRNLDLRRNRIKALPASFTAMSRLGLLVDDCLGFILDGNPIEEPPLAVCRGGIWPIASFFHHTVGGELCWVAFLLCSHSRCGSLSPGFRLPLEIIEMCIGSHFPVVRTLHASMDTATLGSLLTSTNRAAK